MNQEVLDWYDSILKICRVLEKFGCSYEFEEPATENEIEACERKLGYTLREDYKDWLRLTKCVHMDDYDFGIYMPDAVCKHCDGYQMCIIGNIGLSPRDYFINLENNKLLVFDDFDLEETEFETFADLLDDMYCRLEFYADDYFPDEWMAVYDEMFPEI